MKIGAHVSSAGGLHNAPKNAAKEQLECFQFFSRPPQGGPAPKLEKEQIELFKQTCQDYDFKEYYIHTPYVLNLCSINPEIRKRSIDIIQTDLHRASLLNCSAIMTHLGSSNGIERNKALDFVINGLKKVLINYHGSSRLLIEISAGSGKIIGNSFEEIAIILAGVNDSRVGVCFDTAHAFASGYDLRTKSAVDKTLTKFDQIIGLKHLELIHINDSQVGLGENKDRHEHIGKGKIGMIGFKALLSQIILKNVNLILETPVDERKQDIENLKKLRSQSTKK